MSSRILRNLRGGVAWLAIILCSPGVGAAVGPREMLEEARRLHEAREVDRAAALFRDALRLAESRNLAREQAEALFGLGRIELEGDLRTRAKESLERALTLFERAGDTTGHAQALAESGQARILLGDGVEGIRRVQAAVETLRGRSGFATHGIVREDETLESFLALRGDQSASATDGRLTADEVYELKLDADLVVLSACSSALGPTGTEGVIGFTRAFLYAGAASVIATSWNVPDASSYELMSRFYRARRHTPGAARALRAGSSRRSRRCVKAR